MPNIQLARRFDCLLLFLLATANGSLYFHQRLGSSLFKQHFLPRRHSIFRRLRLCVIIIVSRSWRWHGSLIMHHSTLIPERRTTRKPMRMRIRVHGLSLPLFLEFLLLLFLFTAWGAKHNLCVGAGFRSAELLG